MLLNIDHPNIIKMYEYRNIGRVQLSDGTERDKLYFVLEHADIGTLFDLVTNCGTLNEELARFYFSKLIDAVEYLHTLGIAHRDIKPLNIFLKNDDNLVKRGDFGHAVDIRSLPHRVSRAVRGTKHYRPLEVFGDTPHNPMPIDIFSCGVTLIAMVIGWEPFFNSENP